ncbi:hypothetical protein Pfo_027925 [Paulownia fortunei]|nr:hypothetical protein Pfo_027925 [Paulownia fortunei]
MALSSVYITAPAASAAAAAMVLYFFGTKNLPNNPEGGGGRGAWRKSFVAQVKKDVKSAAEPKLAPQFDGLFCFETIVHH